ncbi:hexose carrier protein hex6 [Phtheirospermum japonicum]|uniref:Hexose carrier protein hex6 n=1 Tax=Phtheirospermum japonicum TaxID=374723 RepID=A0A830DE28_9LAMI|nr:hexose carrier protein hex6 [Phtheirospermum japonicum]
MAPSKYRGAFNVAFQICVSIGYNSATLINYGTVRIAGGWGWRISIAMAGVPAGVLAFGALFLPETPNSLIQNDVDSNKTKILLQKIRGTDDVQDELDDLIEASHASKAIKHPFKNLMRRKYRPQLVMSVLIPFFQQITGINIIAFYAPILFLTIGTGENASLLSATVTGIVSSTFTVITVVLVDKIGRRPLFHFGGMQMLISQLLVGGIMAAKLGGPRGLGQRVCAGGADIDLHPVGGAEHRGGGEPVDDVYNRAGVLGDAVPFEVGDFLLLRGVGFGDVGVCLFLLAGDQEYSDRENGSDLGTAFFLETVCR